MNLTKKDKDAIYHVASVSKNPHAAMIVKWLITGWDVEFINKVSKNFEKVKHPAWLPSHEYRLIEPKPAKPAYRVYIDRDGEVFTARRSADGNINQAFEAIEWLSDWIEYDPPNKWHPPLAPKQWPTPLVERIAAIDIKAAEWIVENWDELLDIKYQLCVDGGRESKQLKTMFDWSESPQKSIYWNEICKQLGE